MKTLEFRLLLSKKQQHILSTWMERLRWIWNDAMHHCQEFDRFSAYYKTTESVEGEETPGGFAPCCPIFGDWSIQWHKQGDSWIPAPYSKIANRHKPTRLFCPLPLPKEYREPKLRDTREFSIMALYTHKRNPDKPWLCEIPSNFIRGVCSALATAWKLYKKGERGTPRFKGRSNPLNTLVSNDAKNTKRDGDRLKIPNLGWVKVNDLSTRWGNTEICSLRLVRRATGWYFQLSGDVVEKPFPKPSTELGAVIFINKDGLHHITHYKDGLMEVSTPKEQKKLLRLQRKLERQQYLSNSWQRTKDEIGKLHERIKLRRRNINHKLSTYLVRSYQTILLQKIKPGAKKRPEPIPINTDPPQWAANGATERSRKNKAIADRGIGQFISFVKQKASAAGREVIEVDTKRSKLEGRDLAKHMREDFKKKKK